MNLTFTVGELVAGLVALGGAVAQFVMVERRLTKVETLLTILVNRAGIEIPPGKEMIG